MLGTGWTSITVTPRTPTEALFGVIRSNEEGQRKVVARDVPEAAALAAILKLM